MTRTRHPSRYGANSIWNRISNPSTTDDAPSRAALADRARREAMGPRPDLTGQLLGDPPPGRSALDRKREAEGDER